MTVRALRNAACEYADRGWHVLPLGVRRKTPHYGLVPKVKDDSGAVIQEGGLSRATADLATVFRWWAREPRANIGIVANPSGLLVFDIDPRHGGDEELHELERELGRLPETVRAETGGGGEHYVFPNPGGDFVGKLGEGVDVRDVAYIVAPPSIHPSGRTYTWDLAPEDVPLAPLPPRWLERLRPSVEKRGKRGGHERNLRHGDPLRSIPASIYFPKLAKRRVDPRGWAQCPFHRGGQERTPSLNLEDTVWACYACQPLGNRHVMGGNIYDLAALLWDLPIPLRGLDFIEVQRKLDEVFGVLR